MKSLSDLQVGNTLIVAENKFNGADGLINLSCLELRLPPADETLYLVDVLDGLVLAPSLDHFTGYKAVKINFTAVKHKNYVSYRSKCSAVSKFAETMGATKGKSVHLYASDITLKDKNGNEKPLEDTVYLGTEKEEDK